MMSDPSLLVLSSLAGGDQHGYAMMEDIERFAGVRLGPGTLDGAITRLEEPGRMRPVRAEDRRQLIPSQAPAVITFMTARNLWRR